MIDTFMTCRRLSTYICCFLAGISFISCSTFESGRVQTRRPELKPELKKESPKKSVTVAQGSAVAVSQNINRSAPPLSSGVVGQDPMSSHSASPIQAPFSVGDFLNDSETLELQKSLGKVESQTIGAVLPLTGRSANIGQKTLRGLQMGLGLHLPQSNFKLAVIDSEGHPDNARRAVEKLVQEDQVVAVVGSVLSKTATAVASRSEELAVPNISLSQKSNLTEIGPYVFRNSTTSEMQVRFLVKWAMETLGLKKFAILYPNDGYGLEFTNYFWDEVLARGGTISAIQSYNPKETDFKHPVQRLVGTFYIEARMEEYKLRQKELALENKKNRQYKIVEEDVLAPIVSFDAIFIPDGAKNLGQIAATLAFNGVKGVKLLGTNIWNTPDIHKRVGIFAGHTYFVDSFWQSPESRFIQEYQLLFKEKPGPLELQAYDAGVLLREMIASGSDSRRELAEDLVGMKRTMGGLGPLFMSSQREVQRPLFGFKVDKHQVELQAKSQ